MNSNVRVNADGSVFFFNQDKQIQPKDIFGVFVTTADQNPKRLVLHRKIDGSCEVLEITAHCCVKESADSVHVVGNIPDSAYETLLDFMQSKGYCSAENNILCVSDRARDLFLDY